MGVKGGPNIPNWETFNTMLDPSSFISYPGTGLTFTNPLSFPSWSNWTMTNDTNLIAGSGISKYVKQTSVQQYSQKIKGFPMFSLYSTPEWFHGFDIIFEASSRTALPMPSAIFPATTLATMSVDPPGGKGTTSRNGRSGNAPCPSATPEQSAPSETASSPAKRRTFTIGDLL